jgi:hypothetical protein
MTTRARGLRAAIATRVNAKTAVPLLGAYVALCVLYVWQASRREAPTIFTDELKMAQLSRAIAETGHPGQRGEATGFTSLAPWLTAPFWRIGNVADAYTAVKSFQAVAMSAAVFPAYAIARFVVSRPWALAAAVMTGAAPALSYSPFLVEEPFAYPMSAIAILLMMRMVAAPAARSIAAATIGAAAAAATRGQLAVLLGVLAISLTIVAARTDRIRRWRATWSTWDRVGMVVLGVGVVVVANAAISHRSIEWRNATQAYKDRIWEYGVWAVGAWAIGVGVLPAIALVAALVRPRRSYACPRVFAFTVVTCLSAGAIIWYAAIKGAYISTIFSSLIEERNVIYLTPLAMAATVLLLAHRDSPLWAIAGAAAIGVHVAATVPTTIDKFPYYEAHGLSILALANRLLSWSPARIEDVQLWAGVAALALILAVRGLRRLPRAATSISAGIIAVVLAWNLTAEIYAADGERDFSDRLAQGLLRPFDWVDQVTGKSSVTILGQNMSTDPNQLWLLEFWNRSIRRVWSVDGTGPGPGPTLTPNLVSSDGRLFPPADTGFLVLVNGVDARGEVVTRAGGYTVAQLDDGALQLRSSQSGIYPDGWSEREAAFNRFDVGNEEGFAVLTLSRSRYCAPGAPIPSEVGVRIGKLAVSAAQEPTIGTVTAEQNLRVTPCSTIPVRLKTPAAPWRIEIVSETFVPNEIDPSNYERRPLGVVPTLALEE